MAGRCGCASAPATGAAAVGSNCITLTGAGTPASPFVTSLKLNPSVDNRASCGGAGLYVPPAASDIEIDDVRFSLVGPGPPAPGSGGWKHSAGTEVKNTDATGFVTIPFPGGAFPTGILSITHSLGDNVSGFTPVSWIPLAGVTLASFKVLVHEATTGQPIVGAAVRVNWAATGW